MTLTTETREAVKAALAENPGAVIDYVAKDHNVTPVDVVSCLNPDQLKSISGDNFVAVMTEIAGWGEITFITTNADVVFESKGILPEGSVGRGMYNLHGKGIGGHLSMGNCAMIAFVSRKLFTSDTHSVQFYNHDGNCMFKIYLGRDENRQLIPAQVAKFQAYRDEICNS